ncbi:Transcription initiation factor TFIID subunit 7 [Fukomys damarensis]|uniref:Transcription initiation factor TFIID subunit 7 n=1 Tax=Fukomys damarensis TaxID=885580 RepID=A0A091E8W8_FUKDA|nr:Transcription initiation factor TFIID subunit 7 [Fukomys damarensis]
MSKSKDDAPHELENQFILRLPPEYASIVRRAVQSGHVNLKDRMTIELHPDARHGIVRVDRVPLAAKLVDLPCVMESLKTIDKKTFYKTTDIYQMLVSTVDVLYGHGQGHDSLEHDELQEIFNDSSSSEDEDETQHQDEEDINIIDTEEDLERKLQDKLNESDEQHEENEGNNQLVMGIQKQIDNMKGKLQEQSGWRIS